jgi:hypothetical protein
MKAQLLRSLRAFPAHPAPRPKGVSPVVVLRLLGLGWIVVTPESSPTLYRLAEAGSKALPDEKSAAQTAGRAGRSGLTQ